MECCIIKPAVSLLVKHLVIGKRQKAPYFSALIDQNLISESDAT